MKHTIDRQAVNGYNKRMNAANVIITVSGTDQVGIISKVSSSLSSYNINIADISQTVLSGNFVMMMVADLSASSILIEDLRTNMNALGESLGVDIHIMHERVFNAMHRI
ncbi:ACT domain-containing protein [Treponema lecithinolyticum]